ncbi:SDR family NAD(P)-dependent oxidoreductase [Balneola vulgaris]|uniref:SDR family NAD(P)-dependent oxidoreductase n=1 Tax=Balneola vulgaris TaxID=287535 RepID=UPI0003825E1B|nr:SDR family oxidoreductase [Balneola vulgaris]
MKNFIVTGASRGIGYQTVLTLIQQGHQVLAVARSKDKLQKLKEEAQSESLHLCVCDITQEKDLAKLTQLVGTLGKVDGLVNNAGMVLNKPFMETSKAEWQSVFDVNLFAAIEVIKVIKPSLNTKAHILNISSMGGFQGSAKFPGLAAYSVAKGALSILSECLSAEFASENIAVNSLCLGAVQTEMLEEAFPGYTAPVGPEKMGNYIAEFLLNGHQFYNGKILPVALNNPE